ncbi:MAG TPA: redoxin domain-containing protein [Gemmatimonadales bacterium]
MNAYRDQYAQLFKGGRNVVLIAISADVDTAQQSWARDAEFPFLFASDTGSVIGTQYGATLHGKDRSGKPFLLDNRNLFVVGPDGKIAYVAAPFREIDPTAYTELSQAIGKLLPPDSTKGN